MVRILATICLLLALVSSHSHALCPAVLGGGQAGTVSGCDYTSNEIGDRTQYGTNLDWISDRMYCLQYTADCTGTLRYAYVYHSTTDSESAKICVYSEGDADSVADSSDVLLGCSGAIASGGSTGWKTDGVALNIAVTNGVSYWVCGIGSSSTFNMYYSTAAGTTAYYDTIAGSYATPPGDLTGDGSWTTANPRQYSMYVEID
jgi:hypothetical protein